MGGRGCIRLPSLEFPQPTLSGRIRGDIGIRSVGAHAQRPQLGHRIVPPGAPRTSRRSIRHSPRARSARKVTHFDGTPAGTSSGNHTRPGAPAPAARCRRADGGSGAARACHRGGDRAAPQRDGRPGEVIRRLQCRERPPHREEQLRPVRPVCPLTVRVLMCQQYGTVPLGRDPRPRRTPHRFGCTDEVTLRLPPQSRVGVQQPRCHVHALTVRRGRLWRKGGCVRWTPRAERRLSH